MTIYGPTLDTASARDKYYGGFLKFRDGLWYWSEWNVSYTQSVVTADNVVTREEAVELFDKRLAELRASWGHNGAKFSETRTEWENGMVRILFRSIRKNGKPGTVTGILQMSPIPESVRRV